MYDRENIPISDYYFRCNQWSEKYWQIFDQFLTNFQWKTISWKLSKISDQIKVVENSRKLCGRQKLVKKFNFLIFGLFLNVVGNFSRVFYDSLVNYFFILKKSSIFVRNIIIFYFFHKNNFKCRRKFLWSSRFFWFFMFPCL